MQPDDRDEIRDLLKRTAVALKEGGVPFALCGGYAAWVRGAPEPDHDADFLVPDGEAERAVKVLTDAGLQVEDPAEDWLTKVVQGNSFVDVLWRTCGHPVEDDLIERAEDRPVLSVHMPVLAREEAEALLRVEPLHSAGGHVDPSVTSRSVRRAAGGRHGPPRVRLVGADPHRRTHSGSAQSSGTSTMPSRPSRTRKTTAKSFPAVSRRTSSQSS